MESLAITLKIWTKIAHCTMNCNGRASLADHLKLVHAKGFSENLPQKLSAGIAAFWQDTILFPSYQH